MKGIQLLLVAIVLLLENTLVSAQQINQPVFDHKDLQPITLPLEMGQIKKHSFTQTRGMPILHEPEIKCTEQSEHHLCSSNPNSHLLSGHQLRAKNDAPIIGILTQPVPQEWKDANPDVFDDSTQQYFVETSHVSFIEQGGARVVAVPHDTKPQKLEQIFDNLNGLYIPGDYKEILDDQVYQKTVAAALRKAQLQNLEEENHFPVMAVSYGHVSMLNSQMNTGSYKMEDLPSYMIGNSVEINMAQLPQNTFIYDEYDIQMTDSMFDEIMLFNDVHLSIQLDKLKYSKTVSDIFVIVQTFHQDDVNQEDEYIAHVEGSIYPFYGFAYRLDKVQYSIDDKLDSLMDLSRKSISHAQKIANLFVDESRLSTNLHYFADDEERNLISNLDTHLVQVPFNHRESEFYNTEIYLIKKSQD